VVGTTPAGNARLRADVVGVIGLGTLGEEVCAVRVLNFSSLKAEEENFDYCGTMVNVDRKMLWP